MRIGRAGTGPDGTIGEAGLTSSTEYLVYARPPEDRGLGTNVNGLLTIVSFGERSETAGTFGLPFETVQPHPPFRQEVTTSLLAYVLPAMALAITTGRAMSLTLVRRAMVFRRLGVRQRTVGGLVAAETLLLSLPGVAAAAVIYGLLAPRLAALPGAGVRYWPGEFSLSPMVMLLSVLAVPLAQVVAAVVAVLVRRRRSRRAFAGLVRRLSELRSSALVLGAVLMLISRPQHSVNLLVIGLVVSVIGLGPAVATATAIVARRMRSRNHGASWLAGARLQYAPLGLHRPATLVALLVLTTTAWSGLLMRSVQGSQEENPGAGSSLSWADALPPDLNRLRTLLPGESIWPINNGRVLIPDCRSLTAIGLDPSCGSGTLSTTDAAAAERLIGWPVEVSASADRLTIRDGASRVFVAGRASSPAQLEAAANSFLSAVNVYTPGIELDPPIRLQWIVPGGIAAASLVLISLMLAFGNRLLSLIGIDRGLLHAGLAQADVRDIQRIEAFVPSTVAAMVGGVAGSVFLWAGAGLDLTAQIWPTVAIEMVAVLTVVMTMSAIVRRIQRRWLSTERGPAFR